MHQNLVFVYRNVDGSQQITYLFDLGGVVSDQHACLSDIVELLLELQLPGCGACTKDLLQVLPNFLQRLRIVDVA